MAEEGGFQTRPYNYRIFFVLFAFFVAILLFGCDFAASIFTHDDAIFGMGGRADRLAGLESLGRRRDDV